MELYEHLAEAEEALADMERYGPGEDCPSMKAFWAVMRRAAERVKELKFKIEDGDA